MPDLLRVVKLSPLGRPLPPLFGLPCPLGMVFRFNGKDSLIIFNGGLSPSMNCEILILLRKIPERMVGDEFFFETE